MKTGIIDITIRLKLSQDVDVKDVENIVNDLDFNVISPTEGIEVAEIISHSPMSEKRNTDDVPFADTEDDIYRG